MPERLNKTIALLGLLCLIWAIGIIITSTVLANKAPNYIKYNHGSSSKYYNTKTFYWGGAAVSINLQEMIAGIILKTISFIFRTLSNICNGAKSRQIFPQKNPS